MKELTIYYYALILPGTQELGPLSILENFGSKHDVFSIKRFLELFFNNLRLLSKTKIIHKIETDMSLALLQSCSQVFNQLNLFDFIQIIYNTYEKNVPLNKPMTMLHICSSHFIKTVCKKIQNCFPDKDTSKVERFLAKRLISEMVHCRNIEEATIPFTTFIQVFGTECNSVNLEAILQAFGIKGKDNEILEEDRAKMRRSLKILQMTRKY